ncbi:MAG: hypothetical protein EHM87_15305 [Burkholderiales bacterium]|nr:MAG: hypothetical protein EHM87_15305 [Burkholderiales bacterium]
MPFDRNPTSDPRRAAEPLGTRRSMPTATAAARVTPDGRGPGAGRPGTTDDRKGGAPRRSLAARELLSNLPDGMLQVTAERFPHVIEALARDWAEPARMNATIDEFVFDQRGDRSGFPLEVMLELSELRARYERWVGPRSQRGR